LLNDAAACCGEKKGAMQPLAGTRTTGAGIGWRQKASHHVWRARTQGHASTIPDLTVWLPMLMTPQKIKKQKSCPTEEIIRLITRSNFLTHFLPLSFFILKIQSPFPTALFALQTLQHCKDV